MTSKQEAMDMIIGYGLSRGQAAEAYHQERYNDYTYWNNKALEQYRALYKLMGELLPERERTNEDD